MANHCCEMMRWNVEKTCDIHPDRFDCPDCLVHYYDKHNSYGLIIPNEAGGGVIGISYCPWCGTQLASPS